MPISNSVPTKTITAPSLQKILLIVGRDLAGDHSLAEDAEFAGEFWRKRRLPAEVYGNGRACVTPGEIAAAAARQPEHTLIVIDAHGDPDAGYHRLRLGEGERFPTAALLRMISSESGGRPCVRVALYMAALVASRANPTAKAFYQSLIANGKNKK